MFDCTLPEIPQETIERCEKMIEAVKRVFQEVIEKIRSALRWMVGIVRDFSITYRNAPTKWRYLYKHSKKRRLRKKYESMIFNQDYA